MFQTLEAKYKQYVASKLGLSEMPPPLLCVDEANAAAKNLAREYEVGIELARDGLGPGFFFNLHGLDTKAVKLSRKGRGASWKPLEKIEAEELENKRILLFDLDVVTGRTLNRAVRELSRYNPKYMDLLLVWEYTALTVNSYKAWRKKFNLPIPEELFNNLDILGFKETQEGIEVEYWARGRCYSKKFSKGNKDLVWINTRRNVPDEIRKTITLSRDFKNPPNALRELEILIQR